MHTSSSTARAAGRWSTLGNILVAGFVIVSILVVARNPTASAAVGDVGYIDYYYGTTGDSKPTGEKPESKLWWNDGYWWGSMYNDSAQAYHIYRLNLANQTWEDRGTELDDRNYSRADALWDQGSQKLYVASHIFSTSWSSSSDPLQWGRVYRYSYNSNSKTYTLDSGFPVTVNKGKSETLVIDKDSTGTLWVTYVQSGKVMVNHSAGGNDASWGTAYALPVSGATGLKSDDIASLIAYDGRIGVMWSNQNTHIMYFASHVDGTADNQWQVVSAYNPGVGGADDHISLKSLQADDDGNLFAVTKTSFTSSTAPIIVLLACTVSGGCTSVSNWRAYTVNKVSEGGTRPILLIDTSNRQLNVFITESESGGPIRRKVANIDNIVFTSGQGDPFIKNATYKYTNNPTSTKQNVNSTTGLVVLASAATPRYYLHNYISLNGTTATNTPTATSGSAPTNTPTRTPTATTTATATPTTTQGGTLSFAPSADTQVKSAYPTSNYGTVNNLRLTNPGINSYLKFTVAGVNSSVTRAKIRLYAYDGSDVGGSIYAVSNNYLNTTTPWIEGGLTWNNAPALAGAPLSTVGTVVNGTWVEFDVTAALQGNGTYSFGLSTTSSNSVFYNSKEAATNQPVLIVET